MTDFAARLEAITQHPQAFTQFGRGVERETLRYQPDGKIAMTPHPQGLGSAYSHRLITTDFAESLLEIITPVSHDIDTLMAQLEDVHHFTQTQLENEKMWPLSMPCYVDKEDDITLAQYGSSNAGKMKTLYREGLKRRYGSLMQIISGVHFNFSFPDSFWDALFGEQSDAERKASRSAAYFGLIRNYYRFGWLIPFFFGASPALCSSFVQGREHCLPFEKIDKTFYLPYATSLRLSDLGYTNHEQSALNIGFNSLDEYLVGLNQAIRTPSENFAQIGVKVEDEYRQLNSNVLQIENELYAPIRPKRVTQAGEKPSDALARGGVEYIEVRALDVNPFSPVGIAPQQVRFLDLLLTWMVLSDSQPMTKQEQEHCRENWNKVVLEGRKPGVMLMDQHGEMKPLQDWASSIFSDLRLIAQHMDKAQGRNDYQTVCEQLEAWIHDPQLTLSAQLLALTKEQGGLGRVGCHLGEQFKQHHLNHQYKLYSTEQMTQEVIQSYVKQQAEEAADTQSFDEFLNEYFAYLK